MNQHDPTGAPTSIIETAFREMTLEDVAAINAMNAAVPETSEPTSGTGTAQAGTISPQPMPAPIPVTILKRTVSGRYRSPAAGFQLELRVDVDRTRPMNRLSGDFLQVAGGTTTYYGSIVVNSPTITVTATQVVIKGTGSFTFTAGYPIVQVTIPRVTVFQPQAPATVQFYNAANQPGSNYVCPFESVYFRTVRIETDRVSDVSTPVFNTYDTGALPSGGPARTLGVVKAYAEAQDVDAVRQYIRDRKEHHRMKTFQKEYLELLIQGGVLW